MIYSYLLQGFLLGFSVATTIGFSGILCFQNMMTGRLSIGFASAFAAALADMSCGVIVVFGLYTIYSYLIIYKTWISLTGGLFLCALGLKKIFGAPMINGQHEQNHTMLAAFGTVYFLSVFDPVSILDFVALCVGLTFDFSVVKNMYQFIIGLFCGSASWWFSWCCIIMLLRHSLSITVLHRIQMLVGAGIFGLGIWTIAGIWNV